MNDEKRNTCYFLIFHNNIEYNKITEWVSGSEQSQYIQLTQINQTNEQRQQ